MARPWASVSAWLAATTASVAVGMAAVAFVASGVIEPQSAPSVGQTAPAPAGSGSADLAADVTPTAGPAPEGPTSTAAALPSTTAGTVGAPPATPRPGAPVPPPATSPPPAVVVTTGPPRTSPPPAPPVPPPPTTASPPPGGTTSNIVTAGGIVTVSCSGSQIHFVSATASDGWSVVVDNRGPEQVEAAFRNGAKEAEVHAICRNGSPVRTE